MKTKIAMKDFELVRKLLFQKDSCDTVQWWKLFKSSTEEICKYFGYSSKYDKKTHGKNRIH